MDAKSICESIYKSLTQGQHMPLPPKQSRGYQKWKNYLTHQTMWRSLKMTQPSAHFDVILSLASAASMAPNWEENDNLTEVAWKLMTAMQHPFACTEACKDSPYPWNPYLLQKWWAKKGFRLGGLPPMWSQAIPSSGHMSSCASILGAHVSAHMASLFVYSTPFFVSSNQNHWF